MTNIESTILEQLNEHCRCVTLDRVWLINCLANQLGEDSGEMLESPAWRQYFSTTSVFVPKRDLDKMQAVVRPMSLAVSRVELGNELAFPGIVCDITMKICG